MSLPYGGTERMTPERDALNSVFESGTTETYLLQKLINQCKFALLSHWLKSFWCEFTLKGSDYVIKLNLKLLNPIPVHVPSSLMGAKNIQRPNPPTTPVSFHDGVRI